MIVFYFRPKLSEKVKEKELVVNKLSLTQQSEEDAENLKTLEATKLQLRAKEDRIKDLERIVSETREKWAQALGNEKAALASVEEQLQKFQKRWAEIAPDGDSPQNPLEQKIEEQAKEISELQHKLNQALEMVRQRESARQSLAEALEMNEQLQRTVEELKEAKEDDDAKAKDADPNAAQKRNSNGGGSRGFDDTPSGNHTPRDKDHGGRDFEKLYRKARKELASVIASRDQARQRLECSEEERELLIQSNARLLKPSAEKEDMNTKSLSTILHLKSLTDQLKLEKENLEQQAKNASQMALAARLASNAKGKLSAEILKEKEALEERLQELEKVHNETKSQLEKVTRDWSTGSGEMTTMKTKLANSLKRSDELVADNEAKAQEIRKLIDSLDKAEREAKEAHGKMATMSVTSSGGGGGSSNFTVDQLNTQISVLKGRLACPVCHYRDKECIIMRCRHMHCKQCVDERISNRSRKCPTCNNKFSEKDVEDVWLS